MGKTAQFAPKSGHGTPQKLESRGGARAANTYSNMAGFQPFSMMKISAGNATDGNWAINSSVHLQKGVPTTTVARKTKSSSFRGDNTSFKLTERSVYFD